MSCIAQSVTELKITRLGVMESSEWSRVEPTIARVSSEWSAVSPKEYRASGADDRTGMLEVGLGIEAPAVGGAVIRGGVTAIGGQSGMVGDAAVLGLAFLILYVRRGLDRLGGSKGR